MAEAELEVDRVFGDGDCEGWELAFQSFARTDTLALVLMDGNGDVVRWNGGAVRLFGHTKEDARGGDGGGILCAAADIESRNNLKRDLAVVRQSGLQRSTTLRVLRVDGTHGWAIASLIPTFDGEGRVCAVVCVAQDITEERADRERLEKSGERYRTLVQLLPDVVYVVSPDGTFVFVSESIRSLGYAPDDLVGKPFKVLIHPDDFPRVSREVVLPRYAGRRTGDADSPKLFDERRSGLRKTKNLEVRLLSKDGGEGCSRVGIVSAVSASGYYVPTPEGDGGRGAFLGTIGVIRDITERKRNEEEHRRLQEQLHQARKMEAIGQLAGGIAHDFNNMLSGISGYAELIKRRNQTAEGKVRDETLDKHIGIIIGAAERAGDLTSKLLAFSRQGKYEVVPIDMHETVHEAVGLLRHTIDRRIEIRLRLSAERTVILGDRAQIENAVLNLAMNACDAMPEGGELTFKTEVVELSPDDVDAFPYDMPPGSYLLLMVTDTGIGMDTVTSARIFEPFFTTKSKGKGTGLGLASVYGTVKSHHGAIEVRSAPGEGAVFTVHLPLAASTGEGPEREMGAEIAKGCGVVLVVDDEEIVRNILTKMLEELGYSTVHAADGQQALEAYERLGRKVDLVVLDMNMPVMSGADCFRELKRRDPNIRVVVTTGYTHSSMMREIRSLGVFGVILKPFKFSQLAELIGQALKS